MGIQEEIITSTDEVIEESIAFEVPQKQEDKPEEEEITLPQQPKEPETEKTDTVLNVQEEITISTDEVIEESIAFEVPQKKEDKPEEEDITLPLQPKEPETEMIDTVLNIQEEIKISPEEIIEESFSINVSQKEEDKPEEEEITLFLEPKEPETEKTDTVLNVQEEIKISTDEVIEESFTFKVSQKEEDKPEEEEITLPLQPKEPETEKTDTVLN